MAWDGGMAWIGIFWETICRSDEKIAYSNKETGGKVHSLKKGFFKRINYSSGKYFYINHEYCIIRFE